MNDTVMFNDLGFLSLSSLLSIYERQQEPESKATPIDEEGISSGDEELNDENDSIAPNELSIFSPKERQLTKFLDSISETFSRTKSIPLAQTPRYIKRRGNRKEQGASQASASGLIMLQQKPTVYIAKNEGTDDEDEKLAKLLTTWIRAIAATGKRPAIEKDAVWTRLLRYCRQRLDVYVTQIESFSVADLTAAPAEGSNGAARARELHSLSAEYKTGKSSSPLRRMVSIAYESRYEPNSATLSPRSKKGGNLICFLGRLRSAYKTLKETVIQLQKSFVNLSIVCLPAPTSIRFTRGEVEERIHALAKKNRMPQPTKNQIQMYWVEQMR
ncbi:hypothetical protein SI65_03641 [Aspergillus cristatus]|uniref:Uncharacterized protein n=1 Tax=Aspergillus cristatus TaxID=573508 RepID=A0A1E3BI58_ASPCR|nr:hypothetical protein SI65_03641 [Aspergillus cristatus]